MTRKLWLAPLAALGVAAVPVAASASTAAGAPKEERIPFADHGGIRDWRAGDNDTIYVQDRARQWYKVELMRRVSGLPFEWRIGFDTGPIGTFDRFSSVVIDRQRVPVQSVVRVDAPPPKPTKA